MTMTFGSRKKINLIVTKQVASVKRNIRLLDGRLSSALSLLTLLSVSSSVTAFSGAEIELLHSATSKTELQAPIDYQPSNEYAFQVTEPEKLAKKLYRKALFHYFQGQPELALRQLTYNKARLPVVNDNALLFEAGLQVSLGLYREAEKNLTTITNKLSLTLSPDSVQNSSAVSKAEQKSGERFDYFASQDLLAVALLQLAEQQISQQQKARAQQTLAKLNHLPEGYYQQYHILSQLAYWPQPANLHLEMAMPLENSELKTQQADAYILLNTALLHIEQKDVENAEQALVKLKLMSWQAPEQSFWQQLFSSEALSNDNTANLQNIDESAHEKQSLQDYASLLLAQLYVEQEQYSLAYKELANFPQNSPFTEQALFLFAYASLQTQHYPESKAIFSLLSTRYPASYLGWQADVLLARQYLIQRDLDTALNQYLHLESKYQQQLTSLTEFEQQLIANPVAVTGGFASKSDKVLLASVWWEKAIASVKLTGQFDKASELDELTKQIAQQQQQVQWLDYAIVLNERRQAKIIAQQQTQKYQNQIVKLQNSRDQLANRLTEAKTHADAKLFASAQQQKWLQRIAKSRSVLSAMANNERYKKKVPKYQQRLNRVEGALTWQLQQKFPQRLWQHQTQLKQLDKLLAKLQQQMNQVTAIQQLANKGNETVIGSEKLNSIDAEFDLSSISKAGLDLPRLKQRQQIIAQDSLRLKHSVAALGNATNANIQDDLLAFIAEQRQSLNYYLHHSRRAMAKILEEFKKIDIAKNDNFLINDKKEISAEKLVADLPNEVDDVISSEGVDE